jgi:purine-binding chemotaxis protein CheW
MSIEVEQQSNQSRHIQASEGNRNEGHGDQYLTVILGDAEYGVDILRVQEIKGWDRVTALPNSPDYLRGVINLRGAVIPIIDLRLRFHMEEVSYSKTTVVVVLNVRGDKQERTMGFVVDGVSDVYSIGAAQLRPLPELGGVASSNFVKSLATVDDKMVILLDVDRLVDPTVDIEPLVAS